MTISIRELEDLAALGWRAADEARLGDWLLRAAGGFTGRANSVLATGHPGMPVDAAIGAAREWYRSRGLPAMIAVPHPLGRPRSVALDRLLAGRGWAVRAATTVMIATARAVMRPDGIDPVHVVLTTEPDDAWLALYEASAGVAATAALSPYARRLLTSARWQAFGSVRADGLTIAIGRLALAGSWAGLNAIKVDPRYRRRGLATALTTALVGEAGTRSAHNVYLQVEDDNAPARTLYRRLGFADHHGYHYRVEPVR